MYNIEPQLKKDETIVYQSKQHWFTFVSPCVWMFIGLIFIIIHVSTSLQLGILLVLIGLYILLKRSMQKTGVIFAITNQRVILRSGIMRKDAFTIDYETAKNLRLYQTYLGRMFHYGTLMLSIDGVTSQFKFVTNPSYFLHAIEHQIIK